MKVPFSAKKSAAPKRRAPSVSKGRFLLALEHSSGRYRERAQHRIVHAVAGDEDRGSRHHQGDKVQHGMRGTACGVGCASSRPAGSGERQNAKHDDGDAGDRPANQAADDVDQAEGGVGAGDVAAAEAPQPSCSTRARYRTR